MGQVEREEEMPEIASGVHTDLSQNEILRRVRFQTRMINNLYRAAAAWYVAALLVMVGGVAIDDRAFRAADILLIVALAISTIGIGVDRAIGRCPVCEAYIRRPSRRTNVCRSCGTTLR